MARKTDYSRNIQRETEKAIEKDRQTRLKEIERKYKREEKEIGIDTQDVGDKLTILHQNVLNYINSCPIDRWIEENNKEDTIYKVNLLFNSLEGTEIEKKYTNLTKTQEQFLQTLIYASDQQERDFAWGMFVDSITLFSMSSEEVKQEEIKTQIQRSKQPTKQDKTIKDVSRETQKGFKYKNIQPKHFTKDIPKKSNKPKRN